jgi:hypothetical protein
VEVTSRVADYVRRSLSADGPRRHLERLARHLTKILSDLRKLDSHETK